MEMNLSEIISEIESCGYTCEAGNLERNMAWIELKAMAKPSCSGNCGMNYCDDNGCIERERVHTGNTPIHPNSDNNIAPD
jgi:hypothetical protein